MKRLAGTAAAYALMAALLVAAPLSASEDPAAPEGTPDTEPSASGSRSVEPVVTEPVEPEVTEPVEPVVTEPVEPVATDPVGAEPEPAEPPPPPQPPAADAPLPEQVATADAASDQTDPRRSRGRSGRDPRATAAADTTVTISDFQFAPSAITIDVGDTVTWRNDGPTAHSATAEDGSFDTGIYEQGQSRSHTFGEAGTFAYFCTPHPNMRGTVTVRAASGDGSGGGGSSGGSSGGSGGGDGGSTAGESAASGSGDSADSSGAALPATGFDTGGLAALGLVTIALGAWLRRRASAAA